ncbi:MAG: arginase [Arenimonas sp.]
MPETSTPRTVALIGAPTDIGAGHRGASMGPEALRVAGLAEALRERGLNVLDKGNLNGPVNPWLPPVDGYRHLDEVVYWNTQVMAAIYASLQAGELPILLGGDHCLGVGSITAVARWCREQGKELRLLWLDAHADFNTHEVTPSGNVHGMPVACLCGVGPDKLTKLGETMPAIRADQIRQIGIRSVDVGEKKLVHEYGLDIYDMRYIDEIGMKRAMEEALEGIGPNTHVHVSFDVDFLDPAFAPGVGTTVPGGPNYREAQLVFEMIADAGHIGSIDIVELNPAFDDHNRTAKLAVDLIESLFGKSTLMRPLAS